jgi:hypothetical protein
LHPYRRHAAGRARGFSATGRHPDHDARVALSAADSTPGGAALWRHDHHRRNSRAGADRRGAHCPVTQRLKDP